MKTFFRYMNRIKAIYRNLFLYYYMIYDKTDIVNKNVFFKYIKLFITFIFKGLFGEFYFNVTLLKDINNDDAIQTYDEIISCIIEINGFEILNTVLYYDKLIYRIKLI